MHLQQAARDTRHALEVLKMRIGHEAVHVFKPLVVLCQQNDVECAALPFYAFTRHEIRERKALHIPFPHAHTKRRKQCTHRLRPCGSAVSRFRHTGSRAGGGKPRVLQFPEQIMRQHLRIHALRGESEGKLLRLLPKRQESLRPVEHDVRAACKLRKRLQRFAKQRRSDDLLLRHAHFAGKRLRQRDSGVHKRMESPFFPARRIAHRGDFKYAVVAHAAAQRKPQGAEIPFHWDERTVRQQIAFHTEDGLKILPVLSELVRRGNHRRERLHHAVIRDRNGLVPPAGSRGDRLLGINKAIHGGHLRMQMQLDPLVLRLVHPADGLRHIQPVREQAVHAHEIIPLIAAMRNDPLTILFAGFDALHDVLFVLAQEKLERKRPGFVGKIQGHDKAFVLAELHLHGKDLTLHGNGRGFFVHLPHGDDFRACGCAEQNSILWDDGLLCAGMR